MLGTSISRSWLAKFTEIIAAGRSARLTEARYSSPKNSGPARRTVPAGPMSLTTTEARTTWDWPPPAGPRTAFPTCPSAPGDVPVLAPDPVQQRRPGLADVERRPDLAAGLLGDATGLDDDRAVVDLEPVDVVGGRPPADLAPPLHDQHPVTAVGQPGRGEQATRPGPDDQCVPVLFRAHPRSRPTRETNDTQLPGRPPRLWVSASFGSPSCRSPASPRYCSQSSYSMRSPLAPTGWPNDFSPPSGLTGSRPPSSNSPARMSFQAWPRSLNPMSSISTSSVGVKQSCTSAREICRRGSVTPAWA